MLFADFLLRNAPSSSRNLAHITDVLVSVPGQSGACGAACAEGAHSTTQSVVASGTHGDCSPRGV